jgi:nucleotide-binding universal stress UspA family protein
MDYRTILVDIDPPGRAADRIGFAARLAGTQHAHLVGVTQTGIDRFLRDSALPGIDPGALAPLFEQLRLDAGLRAAEFDVQVRQAGGDVAETLLSLANDGGADLLVLGCYGHSRFRELLLGGVSRTVLRRLTLPALMAH